MQKFYQHIFKNERISIFKQFFSSSSITTFANEDEFKWYEGWYQSPYEIHRIYLRVKLQMLFK